MSYLRMTANFSTSGGNHAHPSYWSLHMNPSKWKALTTYLDKLLGINLAGGAGTNFLEASSNIVIVFTDTSLLASRLYFFCIKIAITVQVTFASMLGLVRE
jgi:hypothetical protein